MLTAPFPYGLPLYFNPIVLEQAGGVLEFRGKKIAELDLSNSAVFPVSVGAAQLKERAVH